MSVFLEWILEILKLLTGLNTGTRAQLPKENSNFNINIHYPNHPREKNKKDVVGTIKIFAGHHHPHGWLPCDGRTVKIREFPDLYTVIGSTFGGNGKTTFSLPDLRGRVVVGTGSGENLTPRDLGETFGAESVKLDLDHIPLKSTDGLKSPEKEANDSEPSLENKYVMSSLKGRKARPEKEKPIENLQPSLALNYIICCFGIHPDDLKDCE
jgi:microcystin-dependent protein